MVVKNKPDPKRDDVLQDIFNFQLRVRMIAAAISLPIGLGVLLFLMFSSETSPPQKPAAFQIFAVDRFDETAMVSMRRWALSASRTFTWNCDVDYPATGAMQRIAARSLPQAIEEMRGALGAAVVPLEIQLDAAGLEVRCPKTTRPPPGSALLMPVPVKKPIPSNSTVE